MPLPACLIRWSSGSPSNTCKRQVPGGPWPEAPPLSATALGIGWAGGSASTCPGPLPVPAFVARGPASTRLPCAATGSSWTNSSQAALWSAQ
eukprot:8030282-Heterocapsa_arctica.AAC.1